MLRRLALGGQPVATTRSESTRHVALVGYYVPSKTETCVDNDLNARLHVEVDVPSPYWPAFAVEYVSGPASHITLFDPFTFKHYRVDKGKSFAWYFYDPLGTVRKACTQIDLAGWLLQPPKIHFYEKGRYRIVLAAGILDPDKKTMIYEDTREVVIEVRKPMLKLEWYHWVAIGIAGGIVGAAIVSKLLK